MSTNNQVGWDDDELRRVRGVAAIRSRSLAAFDSNMVAYGLAGDDMVFTKVMDCAPACAGALKGARESGYTYTEHRN